MIIIIIRYREDLIKKHLYDCMLWIDIIIKFIIFINILFYFYYYYDDYDLFYVLLYFVIIVFIFLLLLFKKKIYCFLYVLLIFIR